MQDLKYYVLGTKNSPLLQTYIHKYTLLLQGYVYELGNKQILSQDEVLFLCNKKSERFLIHPDISASLIALYKNSTIFASNNFCAQVQIYLRYGIDAPELILNQGAMIPNTNIKLSDIENNPYSTFDAHPDHKMNGGCKGWGKKSEAEWLEVYTKTFRLLKKIDTGIYDELNFMIQRIVPLGTAENIHNSASYKECIGHIYLGYTMGVEHPEINILEAIIHESSHNKLNLLMHFDPLLNNPYEEKYYSAIRPDARPISGVFLGYHAFAPTIYILMKAYISGALGESIAWKEKLILFYLKTKFLQKVIHKHADFTPLGQEVSDEIDYVITLMTQLFPKLQTSRDMLEGAQHNAKQHFQEVNSRYAYLCY